MLELKQLTRRDFLKIAGSTLAVLTAGGCLFPSREGDHPASMPVSNDSIPVRNPAFKAVITNDRIVVYCQTGEKNFKAYALSQSGYDIWRHCLSHEDFMAGQKKSVGAISNEINLPEQSSPSGKLDAVKNFLYSLQQNGLVFQAGSDVKIYIPRHA